MAKRGILKSWINEISNNKKVILFSLFLLVLAVVINYNAGVYVRDIETTEVGDFVLDNINPVDLTFVFVYVWMAAVGLLFIYPLFFNVRKVHEILSQFSLLVIVRSFFITLTHLKTPSTKIAVDFPGLAAKMAFQNDLFFSGHTAITFLGFLVFKESKIKWVFLGLSILMAVTVLLMHQHYTIDVLAAYFIAYGTYKIGQSLFSVLDRSN